MSNAKGLAKGVKRVKDTNDKAKVRFDNVVTKVLGGNYKGTDLISDLFDQWQDLWTLWTGDSDKAPIAYIYARADGTNTNYDSFTLTFDQEYTQAQATAFAVSDLLGPSDGAGNLYTIAANKVQVRVQPAPGPSAEFQIRITKAPPAGGVGFYRGIVVDGQNLICDIYVYGY